MIIYHDTSYVKPSNAKWIAKGYAMEDIYSLRLQFLYTEAQQEEKQNGSCGRNHRGYRSAPAGRRTQKRGYGSDHGCHCS